MVPVAANIRDFHIFTEIECVHLGGGRDTSWVIECDKGKGGEKTDTFTSVVANGGDIFLCNGRLNRSHPRPKGLPEGDRINYVSIIYLAKTQERHRLPQSS